jgi:cytochrome c553
MNMPKTIMHRMNMHRTLLAVVTLIAGLAAGYAAAADIEAGKKKVQEVCAACHNQDGVSTIPEYPKLAGQYSDYLAKALRDYKSGARKNPIMAGFAQGLSPKDIEDVSAYFASLPPVLITRM